MKEFSAKEICANFTPKAIRCDENGSVLIRDRFSGMEFWTDVWVMDGSVQFNWNQYIFMDNDINDIMRKEIQEDYRVTESVMNCAFDYVQNNSDFPNFIFDSEKMADFNAMDKERFLQSYSYITEEEYNNTKIICYGTEK